MSLKCKMKKPTINFLWKSQNSYWNKCQYQVFSGFLLSYGFYRHKKYTFYVFHLKYISVVKLSLITKTITDHFCCWSSSWWQFLVLTSDLVVKFLMVVLVPYFDRVVKFLTEIAGSNYWPGGQVLDGTTGFQLLTWWPGSWRHYRVPITDLVVRFLTAGMQMTVQRSTAMAAIDNEEMMMKTASRGNVQFYNSFFQK